MDQLLPQFNDLEIGIVSLPQLSLRQSRWRLLAGIIHIAGSDGHSKGSVHWNLITFL
jgi:hypothetical protein